LAIHLDPEFEKTNDQEGEQTQHDWRECENHCPDSFVLEIEGQ
jgi:hypothetical protein